MHYDITYYWHEAAQVTHVYVNGIFLRAMPRRVANLGFAEEFFRLAHSFEQVAAQRAATGYDRQARQFLALRDRHLEYAIESLNGVGIHIPNQKQKDEDQ